MIARLRWSQFVLTLWNREGNMAFYYFLLLTPVKNGAIMAGVGRCQGSTRARWQGRSTNSK